MPIAEAAPAAADAGRPRREGLLPPAIILLVFAMLVFAIGGFAFIGGQQNALNGLRSDADAMREASSALARADASVARVIAGDREAMSEYFRTLEWLKMLRAKTFDRIDGVSLDLDALIEGWGAATSAAAEGDADKARALLLETETDTKYDAVSSAADNAVATARADFALGEQRIELVTLGVLLLQVLSGAVVGGIWLTLIGFFLQTTANAGYAQMALREALARVPVRDVMARDVVSVPADASVEQLVDQFWVHHFTSFPVVEAGRPVGIASVQQVHAVPRDRWPLTRVREVLHPGGIFAMWADGAPDPDFERVLAAVFGRAQGRAVSLPNPLTGGESASTVYLAGGRL